MTVLSHMYLRSDTIRLGVLLLGRGGHPVRADFSFENGENRVIPRDRYMSLDTQNTKNHHQSIYLTRVVLRLRSELFCIGSTARSHQDIRFPVETTYGEASRIPYFHGNFQNRQIKNNSDTDF